MINFNEETRVVTIDVSDVVAENENIDWRWKFDGDVDWQPTITTSVREVLFNVGARFGTLVTEARSAFPEGTASEWACLPDYVIPAPTIPGPAAVELDANGCPIVTGIAAGTRISWIENNRRFEGTVETSWAETQTGKPAGIPWRRGERTLTESGRDKLITLGTGEADTEAQVPNWALFRGNNQAGFVTQVSMNNNAFTLLRTGTFRLPSPIVAIRGTTFTSTEPVYTRINIPWTLRFASATELSVEVLLDGFRDDIFQNSFGPDSIRNADLRFNVQLTSDFYSGFINFQGISSNPKAPLSKWRLAFNIEGEIFAFGFGSDTDDPFSFGFTNVAQSAAFKRMKARIDGGGEVGTFNFALIDTTNWSHGTDWGKAFETSDNDIYFNPLTPNVVTDEMRAWFASAIAGSGYTVALLDGTRRCAANPLAPVQVDSDPTGITRELIYVVAPSATLSAMELPDNNWIYLGGNNQTRGGLTYLSNPPSVPDTGVILQFYRDVTYVEIEEYVAPADPWKGPLPLGATTGAGEITLEEVIYGASDEATLEVGEFPLDTWTFEQVTAVGITRDDVTWSTNLEDAGYGALKPYGFRASRLRPSAATAGDIISDTWRVNPFAHFGLDGGQGISGQDGRLSVFGYNVRSEDTALPVTAGAYRFFTAGTATAGSGTNAAGTWEEVKKANYVEISKLDSRGLPVLPLEDMLAGDRILYEPVQKQWATFNVVADPVEITNGWRINVELAANRDGSAEVVDAATNARFIMSRPRRQKPAYAKTYRYSYQNTELTSARGTDLRGVPGRYSFHTGSTPSDTNIIALGTDNFVDLVADCQTLVVAFEDDNENAALAWDRNTPEDNSVIIYEQDRQQWCAWEVTSRDVSNSVGRDEPFTVFGLRLIAYDARFSLDLPSDQGITDILFRLSEYAEDLPQFLQVELAPIPDQREGAVTSLDVTARVYGNAVEGASPPDIDWLWLESGAGVGISWNRANTGLTSTATITFRPISADSEIQILAIARIPSIKGYATDQENFNYLNAVPFAARINMPSTAGAGTTVRPRVSITRAGSTPYTYAWTTTSPRVTIDNADTATPSFTMPSTGSVNISLRLTDSTGAVASIRNASVTATNQSVTISAPVSLAPAGGTISLSASVRGTTTGSTTYRWSVAGGGTLSSTNTETTTLTMPASGSTTVSLSVTRQGVTTRATPKVFRVDTNAAFNISVSVSPTEFTVGPGESADVTFTAAFSNPTTVAEIQMQRFGWVAGRWIDYDGDPSGGIGTSASRDGATAKNQSSPWTYTHRFTQVAGGAMLWRAKYKILSTDNFNFTSGASEIILVANKRT